MLSECNSCQYSPCSGIWWVGNHIGNSELYKSMNGTHPAFLVKVKYLSNNVILKEGREF